MKALLVVSFGTTHDDTRVKTIEKIEQEAREAFKDYKFYRAWTSGIIISRMKKRNFFVDNMEEAMQRIISDGNKELIVLNTHIINGIESDKMLAHINKYRQNFDSIKVNSALLTDDKDYEGVIKVFANQIAEDVKKELDIDIVNDKEFAVVLMGHGSAHYTNASYAALDYRFKSKGYDNFYIANVEGYPYIEDVIPMLENKNYKKVFLMPFMIVAGEHAKEDMAGDEEDSYKSILKSKGYEVKYLLKGIGEYKEIRELFIRKVI